MNNTLLITGGAGFIGSSLAEQLALKGYKVVVADNLVTGELAKIPSHEQVNFCQCDVNNFRELSDVFSRYSPDYVFHYAALVGVQRTLQNPLMVLEDIKGIESVLKLSKDYQIKRVFYASSSEVYGEPVEIPQNEFTTPLNSRLPYAIVKNVGEAYFRSYQKQYALDFTIFRFFNTYGPKQSRDFVVSKFINAALKNQPITIHGDGMQTRTFCFIDDHIEATVKAFEQNLFVNDVINIGSDNEITILELAQRIIRLTESRSKIVHLPALEEGDMRRRLPDNSKMLSILQRELLPLEQGIGRILADSKFIVDQCVA
ncbi:MAG: NAD-dependent epimerase/dehydratase family protein [Flavobacteriales bacterium]